MTEGINCAQRFSATLKGIRSVFSPCFSMNNGVEQNIVQKNKDTARLLKLEEDWKNLLERVQSLEKDNSEVVTVQASQTQEKTLESLQQINQELAGFSERLELIEERMSTIEKQSLEQKERVGEVERNLVKVEQASWLSVDLDSTEEEESLQEKN